MLYCTCLQMDTHRGVGEKRRFNSSDAKLNSTRMQYVSSISYVILCVMFKAQMWMHRRKPS